MKRLISANTSEMLAMNAAELKQSIKASEGRVILSENVATRETYKMCIRDSRSPDPECEQTADRKSEAEICLQRKQERRSAEHQNSSGSKSAESDDR